MYPGAQVQLKWSAASVHVAPFWHTPTSHADSNVVQFGDGPGAPVEEDNVSNIPSFITYYCPIDRLIAETPGQTKPYQVSSVSTDTF